MNGEIGVKAQTGELSPFTAEEMNEIHKKVDAIYYSNIDRSRFKLLLGRMFRKVCR